MDISLSHFLSVLLSHSLLPIRFLALADYHRKEACVHVSHLCKWKLQMTSALTLLISNKEPTNLYLISTLCREPRRDERVANLEAGYCAHLCT